SAFVFAATAAMDGERGYGENHFNRDQCRQSGSERGKKCGRKVDPGSDVCDRYQRCEMREHHPQRKSWWVSDPPSARDHRQLAAVDEGDGRCVSRGVDRKSSEKDNARGKKIIPRSTSRRRIVFEHC